MQTTATMRKKLKGNLVLCGRFIPPLTIAHLIWTGLDRKCITNKGRDSIKDDLNTKTREYYLQVQKRILAPLQSSAGPKNPTLALVALALTQVGHNNQKSGSEQGWTRWPRDCAGPTARVHWPIGPTAWVRALHIRALAGCPTIQPLCLPQFRLAKERPVTFYDSILTVVTIDKTKKWAKSDSYSYTVIDPSKLICTADT